MAATRTQSPWRDRAALALLAPLWVALVAIAWANDWQSNYGVDGMTLWEQVRAVADHGTIDFDNGPVERYAELRPRWFIGRDGRTWGIVPAVAAYVLAPFARLGGFSLTARANWLFLGLAATLLYGLVRRLTGSRAVAVGGAYALAFATSLPSWGNHVNPFVLLACASTASLYAAHHALRAEVGGASRWGRSRASRRRWPSGRTSPTRSRGASAGCACCARAPCVERLARAAGYGLGSAPPLLLAAWVNHRRFGTWNPVSYGPCDSTSCNNAANNQTSAAFFETVRPALPWFVAFAVALWATRRSPRAAAAVGFFGSCGAMVPETPTHGVLAKFARTVWGYVVNLSSLDIPLYQRAPDGVGTTMSDFCVRTALQCSPWLVAALLARQVYSPEASREPRERVTEGDAALRAMAALTVLGILAACVLRVDTGGFNVWGFPILNIRYTLGALPAAAVLALLVAAELPWHPLQFAVLVPGALAFARSLRALDESDAWRREATILWPLYGAVAILGAVSLARSTRGELSRRAMAYLASTLLLAGALYGAALAVTVDVQFVRHFRGPQEARAREVERCTRGHAGMILMGGYALDESLALHGARDVLFVNLGMGPRDGANARTLVLQRESPERPAFVLQETPEGPWHFDWEGLRFDAIAGCPRVQRVVRVGQGPAPR